MDRLHSRTMGNHHNRTTGNHHNRITGHHRSRIMGHHHNRITGHHYDKTSGKHPSRTLGHHPRRTMGHHPSKILGHHHTRAVHHLSSRTTSHITATDLHHSRAMCQTRVEVIQIHLIYHLIQIIVQLDQVKEVVTVSQNTIKEMLRLLIRETSTEQSLRLIMHMNKEDIRAMHDLDKGDLRKMLITALHKMEVLGKYLGDIETFHLPKIIDLDVFQVAMCTRSFTQGYG